MRDNVLCDYAIGFLDICYLSIQSSWRLTFTFANLVVRCNEGRNGAACRTSSSVSEEGGQLSEVDCQNCQAERNHPEPHERKKSDEPPENKQNSSRYSDEAQPGLSQVIEQSLTSIFHRLFGGNFHVDRHLEPWRRTAACWPHGRILCSVNSAIKDEKLPFILNSSVG
jgi:hypothetical protein